MNNNAALGEILYILSNYEKGRVNPLKLWSGHYRQSLRESLDIMNLIVFNIGTNIQIKNEMEVLCNYIKRNIGIIFIKPSINFEDIPSVLLDSTENETLTKKQLQIHNLMKNILYECNELLIDRSHNYKKKITYLLMALHNLPMVYVNSQKNCIFGVNVFDISEDDAISYAESYLESKNDLN